MLKKSLHIALSFILLFAITGFTSTISECCCMKKSLPKTCCEKKKEQENKKGKCCLKAIVLHHLETDLFLNHEKVNIPDFLAQAIVLFSINEFPQISINRFSGHFYTSPPGIRDIPVLVQCFRN